MQILSPIQHVSEEELSLHALNDLPDSDAARVADHLLNCRHCRRQFDEVREFITMFRLAARQAPAPLPAYRNF